MDRDDGRPGEEADSAEDIVAAFGHACVVCGETLEGEGEDGMCLPCWNDINGQFGVGA